MSKGRLRLVAFVVVLVALPALWGLTPVGGWLLAGIEAVRDAGPWGVALYGLIFGGASLAAVPASFGMMAAGFVWGPVGGTVAAWLGAVAFAGLNLSVARTVARGRVIRGWSDSAVWQALDERLAARGLSWVVLLRLSPMSPFHVVSYALGASRVGVVPYLVGTALGVLPAAALYALVGASATQLARVLEGGPPPGVGTFVALALTLVASAGLTWRVRAVLRELAAGATGPTSG